jgi:hypothetical protein
MACRIPMSSCSATRIIRSLQINLRPLAEIAGRTLGFGLHVFPGSGHGFLGDLDCDDPARARNARAMLAIVEDTMLVRRADAAAY